MLYPTNVSTSSLVISTAVWSGIGLASDHFVKLCWTTKMYLLFFEETGTSNISTATMGHGLPTGMLIKGVLLVQ